VPVELNIVESVTELDTTVVDVILESASTPGPAGADGADGQGVPTGGTTGQRLAKASNADFDTEWTDAGTPGLHASTHQDGGSDEISLAGLSGTSAALQAHLDDAADAHDASAISILDAANDFTATDVEGALAELQSDAEADATALSDHIADATAAHAATAISFTPDGSIAATTVQAAIVEVRDEAGAGGAPTDVDYLVGTASGGLSAEIVVGTSPGGELGGTWASPTVDATHSGSSHAAVQAAAEATAAAALSAHLTDTADAHDASAISVDSTSLSGTATDVQASLEELDNLLDDHSARHENGGADEISIAGLDGTPTELTNHLNDTSAAHAASAISADSTTLVGTGTDVQAVLEELDNGIADHLADTSAAHAASAISFSPTGTIAATDVQAAIAEVASEAGGGVPSLEYETRSSNTILGTADKGKTIDITATITQTFEADETLGDGWWVILRNATDNGTTVVTLNPAGTETIDGLTTVTMYSGEARLIYCNGSGGNFNSVLLEGGFARFTADGNFIVPHGITQAIVECVGGGGGGGGGRGASAGSVRQGGSGGGGGARVRVEFAATALGSAGDTIAVDIAAGGTSGAGGNENNGSSAGVGGNTTFGALLTAYGGGAGTGGGSSGAKSGASGGGVGEVGAPGTAVSTRGGGNNTAGLGGMGGAGAGQNAASAPSGAEYGGGAGGQPVTNGGTGAQAGGSSVWGGAGGAAGGGMTSGGAESAGGSGGAVGVYQFAATGGGGTAGAVNGQPGGDGAPGDLIVSGAGGGGGGSQDSGTGGAGGAGGAPGGGAGGGGGSTSIGGAGGVGGIGECRVWYS
jgi:hypothetical protein